MALTVTEIRKARANEAFENLYKIAFDNSYTTGGLALTSAQLGFTGADPERVLVFAAKGYSFFYDTTNKKVLAYTAANTEVANGVDLSVILADVAVLAIGKFV